MSTGTMVITGGCGFIGSHVAAKLAKRGFEIYVLDDQRSISSIFSFIRDHVIMIKSDIENIVDLGIRPEFIVHLAAVSTLAECELDRYECFRVNVLGTYRVAQFAKRTGAFLIMASSREVYGEPEKLPVPEDHPLRPKSTYGLSKSFAEDVIEFNLPRDSFSILRISNVYGFGDKLSRAIPSFVFNGWIKKEIEVFGGNQVLDYVHVDDVSSFIELVISKNLSGKYNVGSGEGIRILELAAMVTEVLEKIFGARVKLVFRSPRPFDVKMFIADIGLAKRYGWTPRHRIKESIHDVVRKYVEHMCINKQDNI